MDDIDVRILAFERSWWRGAGAKDQAIRDEFDLTATAYYARLTHLLDDPAAIAAQPQLVARLRRVRDGQRRLRTPRRVA